MHFFIALERELEGSFNYIEPEAANLDCYGAKFVALINSIGVEFESLAKALIKCRRPEANVGHIGEVKQHLLELFPNICSNEVEITRLNECRSPFEEWANGERLGWWSNFTDIKHNRIGNFEKANLGTVLDAMCCLIVIILYLARFRDGNYHARSSGLFAHPSMGTELLCKGHAVPDEGA